MSLLYLGNKRKIREEVGSFGGNLHGGLIFWILWQKSSLGQ